jgi:hypothetical protein
LSHSALALFLCEGASFEIAVMKGKAVTDQSADSKEQQSVSFLRGRISLPVAIAVALIAAVSTLFGGLGGAWIALLTKDHELKIRLVEVGIGILRADPKEKVSPARGWALRLIQKNSGENFTPDEWTALLNGPLGYVDTAGDNDGYIDTKGNYGSTDAYPNTKHPVH